jgi:hypothetical protein
MCACALPGADLRRLIADFPLLYPQLVQDV